MIRYLGVKVWRRLGIDSSVSVTLISGDPHFPREIRASPRCSNLCSKREPKNILQFPQSTGTKHTLVVKQYRRRQETFSGVPHIMLILRENPVEQFQFRNQPFNEISWKVLRLLK